MRWLSAVPLLVACATAPISPPAIPEAFRFQAPLGPVAGVVIPGPAQGPISVDLDFAHALAAALRQRGERRPLVSGEPVARLTVAVERWGVLSQGGAARGRHCFAAATIVLLERRGRPREIRRVELGPNGEPAGAPPAQCASLEKFSADGARLAKEAAQDAAVVLAGLIGERLEALR